MTASSLGFLVFALAAVVATRCAPRSIRGTVVFPLCSLGLLLLAMPLAADVWLAAFLLLAYGATRIARQASRGQFVASIVAVLLLFFYLKGYPGFSRTYFAASLPVVVGLSYVVIRCLQVIVDVHEGTLPAPPSLWRFLQFAIAWPMLLSGPIMTYQQFSSEMERLRGAPPSPEVTYDGFARVVIGAFFVVVPGGIAFVVHSYFHELILGRYSNFILPMLQANRSSSVMTLISNGGRSYVVFLASLVAFGSHTMHPAGLAAATVSYLVFLYFNFAGYTSIVIGIGQMIGIRVPENFDLPWASVSFLDLWSRWHITLAQWFKMYVFNPIVKSLLKYSPDGALGRYAAVIAFFVTFFLVGIWHGPDIGFVLCGLGLGLGVSVNKLWQIWSRAALGKPGVARLHAAGWYRSLGAAAAMTYLAYTIIPFWAPQNDLVKLVVLYGIQGHVFAIALMLVLLLPVSMVALAAEPRMRAGRDRPLSPLLVGCALAVTLVYLALYPAGSHQFVYQRF